MAGKTFLLIPLGLCGFIFLICTGSCSREYSLEGNDTVSINMPPIPPADTVPSPPLFLPQTCQGCSNEWQENKWSFIVNNTLLCGIVDTAIRSPTQQAFTFYGPSLCSEDSGLVVTATLAPDKLDRNLSNYTIPRASMYYYDHVGNRYMLESRTANPFRLLISNYNHQTREVNGTFSGIVYTHDGREVNLQGGRWKTFLK